MIFLLNEFLSSILKQIEHNRKYNPISQLYFKVLSNKKLSFLRKSLIMMLFKRLNFSSYTYSIEFPSYNVLRLLLHSKYEKNTKRKCSLNA